MNEQHPLLTLLQRYVSDFDSLKENNEDIDNLTFNRNYGLVLNPPSSWPNIDSIVRLIEWASHSGHAKSFLVIYPSTSVYDRISKELKNRNVNFFSWHEFAVAMNRAATDMQYIQSLRSRMETADLVVFVGASTALQDVVDQVRGFCNSCLILLG